MRSTSFFAGLLLPLLSTAHPFDPAAHRLALRQSNETCALSAVAQPSSSLTPPPSDQQLVLIAVGKGTQNYTCANATATPSAIGAVAQLFNESCAIADNTASSDSNLGNLNEDAQAIGMHFFVDTTTPDFDIIGLGNTELKKAENASAPDAATDVPWLRLEAQTTGTTSAVKQIYRLNTAGGQPPATCAGQEAGSVVQVDYEAQYWVYACPDEMNARRKRRALGLPLA